MSVKTTHRSIALILVGMLISFVGDAQEIGVMTYNIRFDDPKDPQNSWTQRREAVVHLIQKSDPDFLGTQEGLHHQITYLDSALANHRYIGVARDDGAQAGEYCALFYDTTRFSLREHQTFWLSESPETPSPGWDAQLHRICTYGLFTFKTSGEDIWVFNTHYDHIAQEAGRHSSELILERISAVTQNHPAPVVLMGDFNATPDQEPISILLQSLSDAMAKSAEPLIGPHGTFTGFNTGASAERRIDYIFVRDLDVLRYSHPDDLRPDGGYVSDHLPVLAVLR